MGAAWEWHAMCESALSALDDFHICVIIRKVVEFYALEMELPVVQIFKKS